MKILFHILLDMNQKTKISTKFPRSKLGVATAVFSLGGVAVYSLGVINPLQASQSEYLQVDGVQNSVQYLTSLVIDSPTAKVEFKYDDASKAVRASGSLNMQNLVVGQGNESSTSSVVFWWTKNNNQWANSVIVWGNSTTNEGNNNVIVVSPYSTSSSENTAILNGQYVVTNGKNITVVNGENSNVSGNYVTVFGDSSVDADHVVVFGDKVTNNESNTFVFNGQDAEFVPEQESAFYANSKVAINGDHANATLDVHGGMMIGHRKMGQDNTYKARKNPATSGTIALFSKRKQTGLCGYDGKAERRVPLSESARKFWLCAPIRRIWDLPEHAVSKNQKRSFPQVWNQNGRWEWESPKWIYGSKKEPQHFLCADGYVPDVADPIGKTGVKCIPCEWAKLGDLNCETKKGDDSAPPVLKCPDGYEPSTNTEICIKKTKCIKNPNSEWVVGLTYDEQIEEYNMNTQTTSVTQKCDIKCDEAKGYKYVAWDPSSSDLNLHNAHCAKSKVEEYQWKCEQKTTWNPFGWTCKKRYGGPNWDWSRYRGCEEYKTKESCYGPKHRIGSIKSSYCYWTPSWSTIVNTTTTYTCTDKNTGAVVDNTFCQDLTKPTDCSITVPVKPLYRCLWGVEYGHLIEWDDEWLSQDTYSTLVSANTSAKCEYVCDDGYEIFRPRSFSNRGGVRNTGLPICKKKS